MARQLRCYAAHWLSITLFVAASFSPVLCRSLLGENVAADAVIVGQITSVPRLVGTSEATGLLDVVNRRGLAECNGDEDNVDFHGNDIGGNCTTTFENTAGCCLLCASTPGCTSWTWLKPEAPACPQSCWLKNSDAGRMAQTLAVSGYVYFSGQRMNSHHAALDGGDAAHEVEHDTTPDGEHDTAPDVENDAGPHDGNAPTDVGNTPTNGGNELTDGGDYSGGACPDPEKNLALHNAARAAHADTAPLAWSPALASSAQAFADILGANCDWYHSGWEGVGENLFWSVHADCSTAVEWWYGERDVYDFNNPDANIANFAAIGHMTQILWRSTTEVGCGVSYCDGGTLVVCHYAEQGNYLDQLGAQVGMPL